MKKISIVFILSLLFISAAFSHPFIPKTTNFFDENYFEYLSNNGQNVYKTRMCVEEKKSTFYLINKSLVTNTSIEFSFIFHSESEMDNFVNTLDIANMEKTFETLRYQIVQSGLTPVIFTDDNKKIERCLYIVKLK